jgi:hypothetical protein
MNIFDFKAKYGTTHKRAGIEEYVAHALNEGADTIAVISSGNLSGELSLAIKETKLKLVNLINEKYSEKKNAVKMPKNRILKNKEEREAYLNAVSKEKNLNLGKIIEMTDFIPQQYWNDAKEMLSKDPDYISMPIGSGKLFHVVYQTIKQNNLKKKIIGFTPKGENGIYFKLKEKDGNIYFDNFSPKNFADKLVAPYMNEEFKQSVLDASKNGHIIYEMTNKDIKKAQNIAKDFETEPSSAISFLAQDESFKKKNGIDGKVLTVNTGKGYISDNVIKIPIKNSVLLKMGTYAAGITIIMSNAFTNMSINNPYDYQTMNNKDAASHAALYVASALKENLDVKNMSSQELWEYVDDNEVSYKQAKGGPLYYQ